MDAVVGLIGSRFGRSEPGARVTAYVRGLLAGLERKNGWMLAEHAGAVSPDGVQRLLRTAEWDVDGVRDDVRGYVLDGLADPDRGCSSPMTPGLSFLKERGRSIGSSCVDLFPGGSPPACGCAAMRRRGQGSTRRVDRAAAAGP